MMRQLRKRSPDLGCARFPAAAASRLNRLQSANSMAYSGTIRAATPYSATTRDQAASRIALPDTASKSIAEKGRARFGFSVSVRSISI
jgi:hypothetical protein